MSIVRVISNINHPQVSFFQQHRRQASATEKLSDYLPPKQVSNAHTTILIFLYQSIAIVIAHNRFSNAHTMVNLGIMEPMVFYSVPKKMAT